MTTKEHLKQIIDQLPDEKAAVLEPLLEKYLQKGTLIIPTGSLGLKQPFNRSDFYDDTLAHRC